MDQISRRNMLLAAVAGGIGTVGGFARASGATPGPASANMADIDAHRALVEAAKRRSPAFPELIGRLCPGLKDLPERRMPPQAVAGTAPGAIGWGNPANGDAAVVWRNDFLFLTASPDPVLIRISETRPVPMKPVAGTRYWYHLDKLRLGVTHNFTFIARGRDLDSYTVAGYTPLSYPLPEAPRGAMSDKRVITSSLYDGATSDYWLYTNPGLDSVRGAPLMIWLDGGAHVGDRDWRGLRLQVVTDNLVHLRRIPPMVHLLINPGRGGRPQPMQYPGEDQSAAMRSLQYDTMNDLFARHMTEEVLPEIGRLAKIRSDGYSRGVAGQSSGGTACFKLGWFRPDQFSRIMPSIAGFTALGVQPADAVTGGYLFPYWIRRAPRRNLRVWMSESRNGIDVAEDGRRDMYIAGSWPLGNIAMAQALKTKLYDFHFRYGEGYHNSAQQGLDLPEALTWLWRGYDPARSTETFEQEATERAKPLFRVGIVNRDSW